MAVDPKRGSLSKFPVYPVYDLHYFVGHGAAVGVTKYKTLGSAGNRAPQGLNGIVTVRLEAVEKVFRIVKQGFAVLLEKCKGVPDKLEVAVQGYAQGVTHVHIPAFPKDGDNRR